MTIRNAKQLRENLEKIKADNEQRIDRLEKRLAEIESRGGSTEAIRRELEQAKTAAQRSEDLAEKALKVAEDRELKSAQDLKATQQRVADEIENRQRFKASRAYIAAGGTLEEFEAAWPSLRQELLKKEVVEKTAAQEANQTLVQSL